MKRFTLLFLLLATPAFAQQPPVSPGDIALGIVNDVGVLGRYAEQERQLIQQLQQQNKNLQAKLDQMTKERNDTASKNTELQKKEDVKH